MIPIAPGIAFDPRELEERFIAAAGPGGQNVNKVASAVQVRLDLRRAGSLPAWLRARAEALGGRKVSSGGVLVLTAQGQRSQGRNREEALARVVALLRAASCRPAHRVPTRPGAGAKRRRLDDKGHRAALKRDRSPRAWD